MPFLVDRTVVIQAAPDIVFRYFTDSARWAAWWGQGSTIDARPGGRMHIRYPDGTEAAGEVIEIVAPERFVFTYGYTSGTPIAPGGSQVTIRLEPFGRGTRLRLAHEFADEAIRDHHVQGWRFQLSLFCNVVADEVHAGAAAAVDAWFDAWAETDAGARERVLARIASPGVRFRDRFSNIEGAGELLSHIAAAQRFMPGIRMQRSGDVRHCQGTVLTEWTARADDGRERARGINVFDFDPDGRIQSVVGFMNR
ncbi:MAG: SRPBCC domain-containing protein [Betaproteobacteria bacterium]